MSTAAEMGAGPAGSAGAGSSMPLSFYHEPAVFERELGTVFAQGWQYAGSLDRLAQPGSFLSTWIARTPVLVVRDGEGELRAFANVCPHRGHAIADGDGCRRTLQCPYHGWTYNLDGRLRKAPRTDLDPTFVPGEVALRAFAVGTWGPLVFVSPQPSVAFDDAIGGLRGAAARRGLELEDKPRRASREWELRCNWKVALDNNTECYHCATIHHSFAHDYYVDRDHYLVESFEYAFTHQSPMRRSDNPGPAPDFHLYYLWPNFMLSARRNEYFYIYHYRPVAPGQTLQMNDYFFPADWTEEQVQETIDGIAVIMREDWGAFESVQRGAESGALEHGIVLPNEEALLCHFQKLHARVMQT